MRVAAGRRRARSSARRHHDTRLPLAELSAHGVESFSEAVEIIFILTI
jgi:hypothetical protein